MVWGSTGTKNPNYSDVLYVEEIVGPDTYKYITNHYHESVSGTWTNPCFIDRRYPTG
jgi:hypothetical protein